MANPASMPDLMSMASGPATPRPNMPHYMSGSGFKTPMQPGMVPRAVPYQSPYLIPMSGTFQFPPVRSNLVPASPYALNQKRVNPGYNTQQNAKRQKKRGSDESGSGEDSNDDIDEDEVDTNDQRERKTLFFKQMTEAQLNRHEAYKRSTYYKTQKNHIKKTMTTATGMKIAQDSVLVMCVITKSFVGEVTEEARVVMNDWGDTGPIKPHHIREAYRRLKERGKIAPCPAYKPRLFKR